MKNIFLSIIILSIVLPVASQELDEAYLESLPEDIRQDLIRKAKEGEEDDNW